MNETYTFSRALHMMRYGGKKMQSVKSGLIYKSWSELLFIYKRDEFIMASTITHNEIMGFFIKWLILFKLMRYYLY